MPKKVQNNTKIIVPKVAAASKTITKASKKVAPAKKASKETKWAKNKLVMGDYFCCHQYMVVEKMNGTTIVLRNQNGEKVDIDIQVLNDDSYSADHFDKQVNCNMTELSDILKGAKDTIFKVEFKKKVDDKQIFEKLSTMKAKDVVKAEDLKTLAKEFIDGETCSIIGHLVKSEQHMGRSLIIDLEASADNQWRQVDHRTIQSIILKNVKYNLNKKSTLSQHLEDFKKGPKWNKFQLNVGNRFSEM